MIRVAASRNCSNATSEELNMQMGFNSFRLEALVTGEAVAYQFARLTFRFIPDSLYIGTPGRITVRWQDVVVAQNIELNIFTSTDISVDVRSFKIPSTVSVELSFNVDAVFWSRNMDEFTTRCGTLLEFSVHEGDAPLLGRELLIDAARRVSESLLLTGDYFNNDTANRLKDVICGAIHNKEGLSIIRLGDGEGRVLGYPEHFRDQEVLTQLLYYHFGPESMHFIKNRAPESWISESMLHLRQLLVSSMRNADNIGLPVADFYRGDASSDRYGMLGYACAMIYGLSYMRPRNDNMIIGTNVFQLAAAKGVLFKEIIQQAERVYIMGPWDLTAELGRACGRHDVRHLRVPGHYTWRGSKGHGQFPSLFHYVEAGIHNEGNLSGSLFLIGAGLLGKHYCNVVKLRGGVAIDIGSVFDSWAKKGLPYAVRNDSISLGKLMAAGDEVPGKGG